MGFGTGALMGLALSRCSPEDFLCYSPEGAALTGGLLFGVAGAAVGGLGDLLAGSETWKRVPRPGTKVTVIPDIGRRHAGARVAVRF